MQHALRGSAAALLCCAVLMAAAKTYAADDAKADTQSVTLKLTGMV